MWRCGRRLIRAGVDDREAERAAVTVELASNGFQAYKVAVMMPLGGLPQGGDAPKAVPSLRVNTPPNAADLTLRELLPGLPDDAMIHLSPEAAESFVPGVYPNSYWSRYGDVKHLTVARFEGETVLPLAPAFETDAATIVIKRQSSPGTFGPAPEGAGEYLNTGLLVPDEIVTIPPIPPKLP